VVSDAVAAVVDLFLDWCQKHRAPHTYAWYQAGCSCLSIAIRPDVAACAIHVQRGIDSYEP